MTKEINIKNTDKMSLFNPKGDDKDLEETNILVIYPDKNKKIEVTNKSANFLITADENSFFTLEIALNISSPRFLINV